MSVFCRPLLALVLIVALGLCPPHGLGLRADTPTVPDPNTEALAYLRNLPETNPYRSVLLRFQKLPAAEREALQAWVQGPSEENDPEPTLFPEQRELVGALAAAVVEAASHPAATRDDWPTLPNPDAPDDPSAITLPGVGLARDLAWLTVKAADELPPGEAVASYVAAAQFGRQQRAGRTLIEQLTGVAIEGSAFSAIARRLDGFSPAELKTLSAAWSSLHPVPSPTEAFAGERDLFFRPIVENIVGPGLTALLAESPDPADSAHETAPAPADDADVGFTRDLRLSALMDVGGGERRISLENIVTGETFSIIEGQSTEGIALLKLDFDRREAVIRRGQREAVVHLESKRIVERRRAGDRLRELMRGGDVLHGDGTGAATLREVLARARAHPGGVAGYTADLLAGYQRSIDASVAAAASPQVLEPSAAPASEDPFLALSIPIFDRLARILNNNATSATVLQAAIHHRLTRLGASDGTAAPGDPWAADGKGFALETTPDGGFELRSNYEVTTDQPLTYKFSAPDAGFVRR